MKKKYVPYYRVSTKQQGASGLGLEAQRMQIEKFLSSVDGEILEEFQDIQSGKKINRVGLNKAIELCIKKQATLVVGKIDRLSRDGFRVMMQLQDAKVEYIDASSPHDSNMIKEIKFSIAKEEVEKISARIRAALDAKRARGETLGYPANLTEEGRRLGPQYVKLYAETAPNNVKASLVVVALRNHGQTFQDIADELNRSGFRTMEGKDFYPATVRRLYNKAMRKKKKDAS